MNDGFEEYAQARIAQLRAEADALQHALDDYRKSHDLGRRLDAESEEQRRLTEITMKEGLSTPPDPAPQTPAPNAEFLRFQTLSSRGAVQGRPWTAEEEARLLTKEPGGDAALAREWGRTAGAISKHRELMRRRAKKAASASLPQPEEPTVPEMPAVAPAADTPPAEPAPVPASLPPAEETGDLETFRTGGNGANDLIVVTYTPPAEPAPVPEKRAPITIPDPLRYTAPIGDQASWGGGGARSVKESDVVRGRIPTAPDKRDTTAPPQILPSEPIRQLTDEEKMRGRAKPDQTEVRDKNDPAATDL